MRSRDDRSPSATAGPFDRLLGTFSDVQPGEGARATVMLLNIFVIMTCSYVMKTVREPLILTGGVPDWLKALGVADTAQVKTYSAAGQALMLMVFVPVYSWFASRVDRMKLVLGVTAFFVVAILLFGLAVQSDVGHIGILYYVWFGLFNMSVVAQFWSYANDIYTKEEGHRLFPVIAVGMTAGTPIGALVTERMFSAHVPPHVMLYMAAGLVLATAGLYEIVNRGGSLHHPTVASERIGGKGAFRLIFESRYIRLIVVLLVLLNIVNTVGEYILSDRVVAQAAAAARADPGFDQRAYVGAYYGGFYFWANIASVVLQILVAPRLVRRLGLAGVLFALPFVALGAYAVVTFVATLAVVRVVKSAENATDYSIMNTARGLMWLPTTREEKYKAKQAVDTFFVRLGDVIAALIIFSGARLQFGIRGFAMLNVVLVLAWLGVAVLVLRENHRLGARQPAEGVAV